MKTHRLVNPNDLGVTAIQSRRHTSLELIEEYASQMAEGLQFDPCSAIETPDGHLYIWDGKHRLEAAIRNGLMLLVELEPGTEQDARWKACSANKKHGLKRSQADVQQAVQEAIKLRPDKSDREIGLWVGCDHKTVGKYRKDMEVSGEIPQIHTRTVVRGEQEYQMEMPIKTAPVETPELNQPVRHLTGFVPADVQASTQKSLALTPQPHQEQENTTTNAPAKPTPTQRQLKSIVKAFMGLEFDAFPKAYEELGHLCNCWQSQEPYVSLVNKLTTHLESLYAIDFQQIGNVFALRDACRAAYDEWTALYHSGYRGVLEPEASSSEPEMEQPSEEPEPKVMFPKTENSNRPAPICAFCGETSEKLYQSDLHSIMSFPAGVHRVAICRTCAAKAHIALLHPDDPEVIAECQKHWNVR